MYQRGKKLYWDYYDGNGKRYRRTLQTADPHEASKHAKQYRLFFERIQPAPEEIVFWGDFKRWYSKYLKENKSPGTQYIARLALRYLERYRKPIFLREITPDFVLGFKGFLQEYANKHKSKPGAAGRNRYVKAVKAMMKTAELFRKIGIVQQWGLVKRDKAEATHRITWHPLEELRQIGAVLNGDLLTCFLLGWEEGLRRGEMAFLYKEDYNPQAHTITIRAKENWRPKTKKSARTIPLRPASETAIQNSIANAPAGSPYIINVSGNRSKRAYLSCQYIRAVKQRLPLIHSFLHKLRHTYATLLLDRGVHTKIVCDLMGHSNILQTEQYIHTTQNQFVEAVSKIPSVYF